MYALVLVEHTKDKSLWPEQLHSINNSIPTSSGATRILSGSWLIELETELLFFGTLLHVLQTSQTPISYQVAFFEKKPEFVSPSQSSSKNFNS